MRTTIAIVLLLAGAAAAEQPKQPASSDGVAVTSTPAVISQKKAGPPAKLTNEERLTLENLNLRAALARAQFERIQEEQQATIKAICNRAGIDPSNCQIDPQTLAVTSRPAAEKGSK